MPIKSDTKEPEYPEGGRSDRERLLEKPQWSVDVGNSREIGEVIVAFTNVCGLDPFFGVAEMSYENGIRKLELVLCYDEGEKFRCSVCKRIPAQPTSNDPGICGHCGQKVCSLCSRGHKRSHWRPQKTIGGKKLCDGVKVFCGEEGCTICHGAPF